MLECDHFVKQWHDFFPVDGVFHHTVAQVGAGCFAMESFDFDCLDRRQLMLMAGLGGLSGSVMAGARPGAGLADNPELKDPWMLDPDKAFFNFLRTQGDLSGAISPQWWRGAYLAIYADRQPALLFRMEGCEMKRIVDLGEGKYQFQYKIFTMFKDPVSNVTLNGAEWKNPLTGEELTVEPNISGAERVVSLTDRGVVEFSPNSGFEAVIHLLWTAQGNTVMHNGYKDRPNNRPIPIKEFATSFVDRMAASDFDAPRLETTFNSTFVAPFQPWMKMPRDAGIAVWHASGHKAQDVESLPAEYLDEMFKYRPEMPDWIGTDGVRKA